MKEDRTIEKMELIIAALEKQVPEKPELVVRGSTGTMRKEMV